MDRITLLDGDLLDTSSLIRIIKKVHPDEIYNLAAQSFVAASFSQPILTGETTALGALRLLEATRLVDKGIKFYQASSSEMFGKVRETPQTEQTPFHPRSPYGVAKTFAHYSGMNYRESYDMFVCGGILFNHESPRRGLEFVTRKISDGVARIKLGLSDKINLGNLDAKRDWGFAGDYVKAMWMMMQQDRPDDYIIATGETHSVGEFAKEAFKVIGVNDWENCVGRDEAYMRPAEVDYLIGDYSKAKNQLGWEPEMRFEQLVSTMVEADIKLLSSKKECPTEY